MRRTAEGLTERIVDLGGIVRSGRVADLGFGRTAVEAALRAGAITRPRRGWLASPTADPLLLGAARHGVVLTCRTQAGRLGLWVHDPNGVPHVAVGTNSASRRDLRAKVHWGAPVIPRHPDALVDPVENVLAHIAECEPFEQALATWESALNRSLVKIEDLRGLPWRPAARRVLATATPFSDAGLETYLRERLRWLRVPVRAQIWIAGHRVDALIGSRLVIQIDGGHHVGAQRSEDIRHDAVLKLGGYHVIRVSYSQMMFEWPAVQDLIMRAVAQGMHEA
ncbi:endonuclease domain-containing protein [Microbacterium sp. MYb45]|uniref:endonuclease domain-containing protein n=1 Tax=Microbacterium sp. MYb45 TaxID=1827294 RepID=UPI002157A9AF|nr:DUF559 domain-containing protein [Microbacterium sp. MYb45]